MGFELVEEAIFLAGTKDLNDPDEGRLRWLLNGTREQLQVFWTKKLKLHFPEKQESDIAAEANRRALLGIELKGKLPADVLGPFQTALERLVRVACFTTNPVNGPMWAHYGTWEHKRCGGICIEYIGGDDWRSEGLNHVVYTDARPIINLLSAETEQELAQALLVKSTDWRYEDEWRLLRFSQFRGSFGEDFDRNSKLRFEGAVRAVIFGLETPDSVISTVSNILGNNKRRIPFKRIRRAEDTQALYVSDL